MDLAKYHINWNWLDKRTLPVTESGCWLYTGYLNAHGYGIYTAKERQSEVHRKFRIHRLFYSRFIGDIPDDLCLCHTCDVPSCVNPKHMFIGTRKDNVSDMVKKNRHGFGARKKRMCKLTESQVIDILSTKFGEKLRPTLLLLAEKYGMSVRHLRDIVNGKCWHHMQRGLQ